MPLDFEPFNYLDADNRKVGLDVDLFEAIADVLGLETDIQRLGFATIIPSVKGGRVDVDDDGWLLSTSMTMSARCRRR